MDVCPFPRTGYPTPHCATVYTPPNYHRQYRTANKMGTAQDSQPCPHLPGLGALPLWQGQSWAWNIGKKQAGRGCSKLFCQLQELCLGRIICNWITLYSKEGSFVFLPYLRFKIFPLGNMARGWLGLFLSQGVPVPGEVWKGGLNSLECLYYTHSAERNMLPPGTRSTRDPTGSHAKD